MRGFAGSSLPVAQLNIYLHSVPLPRGPNRRNRALEWGRAIEEKTFSKIATMPSLVISVGSCIFTRAVDYSFPPDGERIKYAQDHAFDIAASSLEGRGAGSARVPRRISRGVCTHQP